jgi:hypothetical protein
MLLTLGLTVIIHCGTFGVPSLPAGLAQHYKVCHHRRRDACLVFSTLANYKPALDTCKVVGEKKHVHVTNMQPYSIIWYGSHAKYKAGNKMLQGTQP